MKNYYRLFDFDILNIENETEQTDSDEDNEKYREINENLLLKCMV